MPQPTPKYVFLFETMGGAPIFRAIAGRKVILVVASAKRPLAYRVVFALYGLPARIIYKKEWMRGPEGVDHLEYVPTKKDIHFLKEFKGLIPHLATPQGRAQLKTLLFTFYPERIDELREWLPSIVNFSPATSHEEVKA